MDTNHEMGGLHVVRVEEVEELRSVLEKKNKLGVHAENSRGKKKTAHRLWAIIKRGSENAIRAIPNVTRNSALVC